MDDIPRKLIIPIKTAGFLFLHHKINNKNRKRLDFEPPEVIAALTFLESHSPGKAVPGLSCHLSCVRPTGDGFTKPSRKTKGRLLACCASQRTLS